MSKSKGFIYVASNQKLYYELAVLSAESLKDFYPDANITLFTHESFLDNRSKIFTNVVTNIPVHSRAKMWAMARTPYDQTFYNDCDSQIVHPDIKYVFDELNDCDMFFTGSLWYTTSHYKWAFIDKNQTIPIKYHGAVCGYNKNNLTIDFHQTWFDEFLKQESLKTWPYNWAYNTWQQFDMFTLWRMTSGQFQEFERFNQLNIKLGPKRFNSTIHDGDYAYYRKNPQVVMQIDKTTFKELKIWKEISKGINDERNLPKELEIRKDSLAYN